MFGRGGRIDDLEVLAEKHGCSCGADGSETGGGTNPGTPIPGCKVRGL